MYVYRFLNNEGDIIYIGKARNLKRRFKTHNHLPEECYNEMVSIQYIQLKNNDESAIYERYLINLINPKYNTEYKNNSEFCFSLPDQEWKVWNDNNDTEIVSKKEVKPTHISLYLAEVYNKPLSIINMNKMNISYLQYSLMNALLYKADNNCNQFSVEELLDLIPHKLHMQDMNMIVKEMSGIPILKKLDYNKSRKIIDFELNIPEGETISVPLFLINL